MAKRIPGKEEFHETIRYFKTRLDLLGVDVRLGTRVTAVSATTTKQDPDRRLSPQGSQHNPSTHKKSDLAAQKFDAAVLATGVLPRAVSIPGIDHPKVLSYIDVLRHGKPVRPADCLCRRPRALSRASFTPLSLSTL